MVSPYLLDDVIVNLMALKMDESVLPPDQLLAIVTKVITDLQVYKRYKTALYRDLLEVAK
jgi:hypothetical protein